MKDRIDFKDQAARPQLIAQLAGIAVPAELRRPIVDGAFQAADDAIEALITAICSHPDPRVHITIHGIALGILLDRVRILQASLIQMAAADGFVVRHTTINLGGASDV